MKSPKGTFAPPSRAIWIPSGRSQREKEKGKNCPRPKSPKAVWQAVRSEQDMTKEEWARYRLIMEWLEDKAGELRSIAESHFARFDANGDKLLSLSEFEGCVASLYAAVGLPIPFASALRELFNTHDADRDSMLSCEEFFAAFRRLLLRVRDSIRIVGKEQLLPKTSELFTQRYQPLKQLGAGAQGVVYLAEHRASKVHVVVKRTSAACCTEDFDKCRNLSHPNMVRVFECFASRLQGTFIVMEYCSGGNLFDALVDTLERFGSLDEFWVAGVFKQCLLGVQYLHTHFKLAHNDLKPENILLERRCKSRSDVPRCMVADLGCVGGFGDEASGDLRYRAPERFEQRADNPLWKGAGTPASDAWSCGMILYEMLSGGNLPFLNRPNISSFEAFKALDGGALLERVRLGITDPDEEPCWELLNMHDSAAVALVKGLLQKVPAKRLSVEGACGSAWFRSCVEAAEMDPGRTSGWVGARAVGSPRALGGAVVTGLRARACQGLLRTAIMSLVVSRLQGQQLDPFYELWARHDRDENGVLDQEEFVALCAELGIDSEEATDIFLSGDIDGNGSMDFAEFVGVIFQPDMLSQRELLALVRTTFSTLTDKSTGLITFNKFKTLFDKSLSQEVLTGLFKALDRDGSGAVTWKEFCSFVLGGNLGQGDGFCEIAAMAGPLVRGFTRLKNSLDDSTPLSTPTGSCSFCTVASHHLASSWGPSSSSGPLGALIRAASKSPAATPNSRQGRKSPFGCDDCLSPACGVHPISASSSAGSASSASQTSVGSKSGFASCSTRAPSIDIR